MQISWRNLITLTICALAGSTVIAQDFNMGGGGGRGPTMIVIRAHRGHHDMDDEDEQPDEEMQSQRFKPLLEKAARAAAQQGNPLPAQLYMLSDVLSDNEMDADQSGERKPVLFRQDLVDRSMDILMREKNKFLVMIGQTGVGKTAVISELVHAVATKQFPQADAYQKTFGNAVFLRLSMRKFIPGSPNDLAAIIDTARIVGQNLKKKIVLVFNEAQFLSDYNVSVLRDEADKKDPVPIVLECDSKSYGMTIKSHPSFTSLAETLLVPEPKPAEIKEILKSQAQPLEQTYKVNLSDEVIEALVDVSPDYRRDIAEPRRSLTLLEDFVISQHRKSNGQDVTPSRVDLYRYVAEQVRLPVIPQNEAEFAAYMQKVKEEIKAELVGQDHMVDGVVDQFVAALTSRTRQHTVALMLGPTGVGKSLIGEKIAEKFYGDKARFLELDMTQFKNESSLTSLFGASNGYVSSDREKGALCDFFDGPGRGGGILVLNEIEEMSSEALTRFMEIFDKGEFRGGDGKVRYIGRTMIFLTSNKGADRILSYETIKGMMQSELDRRLGQITQDQLKKAFTEKSSYTEDSGKVVKAAVLERVDKLYFASPLLKANAIKVAQIEIARYKKNYEKQGETKLDIDPSVAEVLTSAFYNESLGARQVRTAVQQVFTKAIQEFKGKYGYDVKNIQLSAALHPSLKTVSYVTAKDPATGNELTIDGPKIPVSNRLLDKEFRTRLLNLAANIKKEIFGQDAAVDAVVAAVKGRYLQGGNDGVVAGFLLGLTGSGKSEIAKLLAKNLYGDARAVGLFEMGKIQTKHDLADILSPAKGVIGSDEPGQLESFLLKYPDGGVLLFDEMSNAGGGDPALKQAIAKAFYTMMQEGYYQNPSGKVYSLHNHIIIFTGNDGEEDFKGLSSDSMLAETYKDKMKEPGYVKNLLSKAGFTDAFIGRLKFSVMMHPTLTPIKILIAKKMIDKWKKGIQDNQPFDITYSEEFVKQIALLEFSPKTGARSIEEFISGVLDQLVGDQALAADWDDLLAKGERVQMNLDVAVTQPDTPFYTGDEPAKTEAIVKLTMTRNGQPIGEETSLDFTSKANFPPQVHEDVAIATAYHEMGHAVTSFTKTTGKQVVKITIVPENVGELSALGYAQYREKPRRTAVNRDFLVQMVAGLLAGSKSESMFGSDWNAGRSNDVERAGGLVKKLVLEKHMVPDFDAAHAYVDKDGNLVAGIPAELKAKYDAYVSGVLKDAGSLAEKNLQSRWHIIAAGAKFLMKYGNINEKEFEKLELLGAQKQQLVDNLIAANAWTKEAAEKITLDWESISTPDCQNILAQPAIAAAASAGGN